ncbi:zinc-dependent alcohol dehydrogenase family protein [Actinocatenispora rupis]|uniref:Alcohol dehydrogenase n=1 Tax=Actinocatenispora rupis TaxID=519421 RepID=A0A8J3NC66_9ACTN|nr:NAD(P)-dependent alcohol dehydrogenase [Actinocatenispora rupis]GID10094.1 alcohol dehydrogenase [Actinocatenispora rupis]
MRSYHLDPGRGLAGLTLRDHDVPEPGRGQIVVRMRAHAVGARDLLVLAGTYPLPVRPGVVPGCEGAGEVVAVGADVTRVRLGDRVAATVFPRWWDGSFRWEYATQLGTGTDGTLTEYALLDADGVVPVPEHLSYAEAAALPLSAVTAWHALTAGGMPRPGETVLTLGSGAVSLSVLQLARSAGARVIVTTSDGAKAERLRELGAAEVVNYRECPDWPDAVRELTAGRGADRVVDPAGPLSMSLRAVAVAGEVALVGTSLSGPAGAHPVDPSALFAAAAVVRPVIAGHRAHFTALNRALTTHRLRPVVDRTFGFDAVPDALRYCRSGAGVGKVVVTHPGPPR